jgi:acetolactate synthase-1/2/3 large subunit
MERFARVAKKIVVDVDPAELAKNSEHIDLPICAKASDMLQHWMQQANRVEPRDRAAWFTRIRGWLKRYPILDGTPFATSGPISHYEISSILSDEIPADHMVVLGSSGVSSEAAFTSFNCKEGQRVFCAGGSFGAMGFGLPAAIGACVGNGRKPIFAIEGDGSLQVNLQELNTVRALALPIKLFIYNNNGYASIRATQRNYFEGNFVGVDPGSGLCMPDLMQLAKAFGIDGVRISERDQIRPTIQRVLEHDGPIICEVQLMFDEVLWPKSSALPQPDGSIISMPLEDMTPLLSRQELRENMLIPLAAQSEQIKN